MRKRLTGTVRINATTSEARRLNQNSESPRFAFIAPGMSRIKILSTASIEIIEVVSVAIAACTASVSPKPLR